MWDNTRAKDPPLENVVARKDLEENQDLGNQGRP